MWRAGFSFSPVHTVRAKIKLKIALETFQFPFRIRMHFCCQSISPPVGYITRACVMCLPASE